MGYTLVSTGCSSGLGLRTLRLLLDSLPTSSPSFSSPSIRIFAGHRYPLSIQQVEVTELAGTKSVLLQWLKLDLTSFSSVRNFASEILETEDVQSIDCLLLNAAVWSSGEVRAVEVKDGEKWVEEAVVNHFSQYYLTLLLLPLLKAAYTKSSRPRVVHTTSTLVSSVPSLDHHLLPLLTPTSSTSVPISPPPTLHSTPKYRYASSKLASLLALSDLSASPDLAGKVDVVTVSPGFVPSTGLSRESGVVGRWVMGNVMALMPFAVSEEEGALRIFRALPIPSTSTFSNNELSTLLQARTSSPPLVVLSGPSTAPLEEVVKELSDFSPAFASGGSREDGNFSEVRRKLAPTRAEMEEW